MKQLQNCVPSNHIWFLMGKIFVFYGSGATATIDATKSKVLNFLYEAQVGLGYCKAGREERRVLLRILFVFRKYYLEGISRYYISLCG